MPTTAPIIFYLLRHGSPSGVVCEKYSMMLKGAAVSGVADDKWERRRRASLSISGVVHLHVGELPVAKAIQELPAIRVLLESEGETARLRCAK
jgi:hypothetical protein